MMPYGTTTTTTGTPTTTAAPASCPIGTCGELTFSTSGAFTITADGAASNGVVDGTPASIGGISYAVSGVDSFVAPTTAIITASGGNCGAVTFMAVLTRTTCI
jgi:hypothetical protein